MGTELHVNAKLAREHIFKLDQFHKPEYFRIEVYKYIKVTIWPLVTPCSRSVDIKRSRAQGFYSLGSRPNTLDNLGSSHVDPSFVQENLANFQPPMKAAGRSPRPPRAIPLAD
jgi:hypothetical protein